MCIILQDGNSINGISTVVDNGKRIVAIDIDGRITILPKSDVVTISPN